jgi:hypothetical protein
MFLQWHRHARDIIKHLLEQLDNSLERASHTPRESHVQAL